MPARSLSFGISIVPVGYMPAEPLAGPPQAFAEQLSPFVEAGFETLLFWPIDPTPEQVELFAAEVAPLLRAVREEA